MAEQIVQGFDELDKLLREMPDHAAELLQRVMLRNHLAHRKEIIRSSTFSAAGKRGLRFAIKVRPDQRANEAAPRRIRDVRGETLSFWKGDDQVPAAEGVAARLEKTIGDPFIRPKRRKLLMIPVGDFRTPKGRVKRVGGKQIQVRDIPNTRLVTIRGRVLAIQTLDPGQRGQFESGAKGQRKTRLGSRSRIVGVGVRQARAVRGIDFFGSWERGEKDRNARFDKLLETLVRGRLRGR